MDLQDSNNTLTNNIQEKSIPKYIYKYLNVSKNLYESLINSELWFASPNSFNDPFDNQYDDQTNWDEESVRAYVKETMQISGEQINPELVVRKYREDPDSYSKFVSENTKIILSNIGACCFSSSPKKILMWSHYADSHKGVCIKFDISKDINLFRLTYNMNYTWKYPKLSLLEENVYADIALTKSKHWKNKNEVRTIKMKPGLYKFNRDCLKEIIFGINSNEKEILIIKKIIKSHYKKVKLKRVQFKKHSFKIKIVEIK